MRKRWDRLIDALIAYFVLGFIGLFAAPVSAFILAQPIPTVALAFALLAGLRLIKKTQVLPQLQSPQLFLQSNGSS
jgi:hypothetical protein